jgi:hypothetical protein
VNVLAEVRRNSKGEPVKLLIIDKKTSNKSQYFLAPYKTEARYENNVAQME